MKSSLTAGLNVIIILAVVAFARPAQAGEAELDAKIEELMAMTNMTAMMRQIAPQIFSQITTVIRNASPDIPKNEIEAFRQEILSLFDRSMPQFTASMKPIYKKHFNEADIDAMIAFYETPTGQKAIRKLPMLMQESIAVGQVWGAQIGREAMRRVKERLREKGYKI
jgi:hypothetical protein